MAAFLFLFRHNSAFAIKSIFATVHTSTKLVFRSFRCDMNRIERKRQRQQQPGNLIIKSPRSHLFSINIRWMFHRHTDHFITSPHTFSGSLFSVLFVLINLTALIYSLINSDAFSCLDANYYWLRMQTLVSGNGSLAVCALGGEEKEIEILC